MNHQIAENIEVVMVTPEIALRWLNYNTHNRGLRQKRMAYAADMRAGAWPFIGDPIRFSSEGVLLDGQHRLLALIDADVTLAFVVIRDLEPETQDVMDSGIPRMLRDHLKLHGYANAETLAAILRRVVIWSGSETHSYQPAHAERNTNTQYLAALAKYPWLADTAQLANQVARHVQIPASILGFCHWLFSQVDEQGEDVEAFFGQLRDGEHEKKTDPTYELRRTSESSRSVRGRRSERYLTAITIKAWNGYRSGEPIVLLTFRPGGAHPERFPEPI